jgi:hypothetical protein
MDRYPCSEATTGTRGNTSRHPHADCKSVAKATQVRILYLPPPGQRGCPYIGPVGLYAGCKLHAVTSLRTPGTGGVIDLWKNRDGTPSKLATGRWAEGRGRPQGVGNRWRGWYVGDDGKQHTQRFRTEAEAEARANKERGKVHTNQWVSPTVGGDTFRTVSEEQVLRR